MTCGNTQQSKLPLYQVIWKVYIKTMFVDTGSVGLKYPTRPSGRTNGKMESNTQIPRACKAAMENLQNSSEEVGVGINIGWLDPIPQMQ